MPKRVISALLAAVMTVLLCSCGESGGVSIFGPKDFPVTVSGTEIKRAPERVICLSPSLTEIIFELGSYAQLCGVCDGCDYPEQAAQIEKMGTAAKPDAEKILGADADLVIASGALPAELADALSLRRIPVVTVPAAESLDALQEVYVSVASALAGAETGKANGENTYAALAEKMRGIAGGEPLGRAVFIPAEGVIALKGSFISDITEAAGFENVAAEATPDGMGFAEYAASLDPDYIFCREDMAEELMQNTALAGTPAVASGRVVGVPPELYERQGGRIYDAAKLMHDALSPSDASETPAENGESAPQ